MASDPDDMNKAERAQRELRAQVRHCRLMVQNGRQFFMLAQAAPMRDSRGTQK
jgi:hypothetical protein